MSRERLETTPGVARVEALERALRIIEVEVYGRPEPFCRRIAADILEVLGPVDAALTALDTGEPPRSSPTSSAATPDDAAGGV